jgi:hypothetical protein
MNGYFNFRFREEDQRIDQSILSKSVPEIIEELDYPLSEAQLEDAGELIKAESRKLARDYRRQEGEKLQSAREEEKLIQKRLAETHQQLESDEKKKEAFSFGTWTRALIFLPLALVCFMAEFTLTWYTIPFILDVRQYSILGVTLAAAPSSALVILDVVIARLFEDPWRSLRSKLTSQAWKRTGAVVLMIMLLVVVAAGNIATVVYLAEAREDAAGLRHNLEGVQTEDTVLLDNELIRRTIIAVSVLVAVDGALFLLLGLDEAGASWRRRRFLSMLKSLRFRKEGLESEFAQATARLSQYEEEKIEEAEIAEEIADRYRKEMVFRLREAQERELRKLSSTDYTQGLLAAHLTAS